MSGKLYRLLQRSPEVGIFAAELNATTIRELQQYVRDLESKIDRLEKENAKLRAGSYNPTDPKNF